MGHDLVTEQQKLLEKTSEVVVLCLCFAESFHFRLRFKGYVNKINHLLYTNKQYQYLLENYLAYFQYSNIKRKVK